MHVRQFLFLVLLAGLILMRESRIEPLGSLESGFEAWLTVNSRRSPAPAPLVLVEIADDDLRSSPWPWSPLEYSLFLNAALPFQPAVLAVEPVLDWKSADRQELTLLHNQLLRTPKVLLGSELGFPEDPGIVPPLQEVPVLRHVKGSLAGLSDFTRIVRQPREEIRLAGTLGFENLLAHGPVARVPLIFRYCGQVVPSFILQGAMLWYGITPDEVTVVPGKTISLGTKIEIPIDSGGFFLTNFGIPFTRFSSGELLLSAEQAQGGQKTIAPVEKLRNSFAILARTDKESRTLRFAGRDGSPGDVFAAALATLQNREFVRRAPMAAEGAVILAALVFAWYGARSTKLACLTLGAAVVAAYLLVSLGVFAASLLALPLVLPLGLVAFIVTLRQLA